MTFTLPAYEVCRYSDPATVCDACEAVVLRSTGEAVLLLWRPGASVPDTAARHAVPASSWGKPDAFPDPVGEYVAEVITRQGAGRWSCVSNPVRSAGWPVGVGTEPAALETEWYDVGGRKLAGRPKSPGVYFERRIAGGRVVSSRPVVVR